MENMIKFKIEIEKEFSTDLTCTFYVKDILFKEYNRMFNKEDILLNYKKAIKKSEGFRMLTIDLYKDGQTINSYRFINNYGQITGCKLNFNKYDNFEEKDSKDILKEISNILEYGNNEYLKMIRENN